MTKFAFSALAEKWKDFFKHATIGYNLRQLLVEVKDNELCSSAFTEGVKHTWVTVKSIAFKTQKTGEFVVNVPSIKDSLTMMKSGKEYIGVIEGNKLTIQGGGTRDTITLAPIKPHKDGGTSYVPPGKGGKRQLFTIINNDIGVPTIAEPPLKGEKDLFPLRQLFSIDASELKAVIKDTKTVGAKEMTFITKAGEESLLINIAKEDKTLKRLVKIPVNGDVIHDWQQLFASQHIEPIVALCNGSAFIGMTDRPKPGTKINPGLWLVTNSVSSKEEDAIDLTACYLVNTLNPEKK